MEPVRHALLLELGVTLGTYPCFVLVRSGQVPKVTKRSAERATATAFNLRRGRGAFSAIKNDAQRVAFDAHKLESRVGTHRTHSRGPRQSRPREMIA